MNKKSVLVSYLEKNKVFKLEENPAGGDVASLKKEFIIQFKFEPNVRLDITFQRFDPDWDCFVDLDEDAEIHHKDQLKAVVTPLLVQETPCPSEAEVRSEVSVLSFPFLYLHGVQ